MFPGFGYVVDGVCMSRWAAIAKMIDDREKPEARKCPRFVARQMSCKGNGVVQDFSATGVRVVFCKRPKYEVGDVIDLSLDTTMGTHRGVVEVMRVTHLGFRKFEVGFRFTDPEAAKKMQLFKCGYDALDDGYWSAA